MNNLCFSMNSVCTIIDWLTGTEMDYIETSVNEYEDYNDTGSLGLSGLCFLLGVGAVSLLNTVSTNVFHSVFNYVFRRDGERGSNGNYEMERYIEEMEREADISEREAMVWSAEDTARSIMNERRSLRVRIPISRGGFSRTDLYRGRDESKGLWRGDDVVCGEHGSMETIKEVRRRPEKGCAEVTCSICLDDLGEDKRHTMETCCGHQYHKVCFDKVVRKEGVWYKCPNCRHERPVLIKTRYLKV